MVESNHKTAQSPRLGLGSLGKAKASLTRRGKLHQDLSDCSSLSSGDSLEGGRYLAVSPGKIGPPPWMGRCVWALRKSSR